MKNTSLIKKLGLNSLWSSFLILQMAFAALSITPSVVDNSNTVSPGVAVDYTVRFQNTGTQTVTPVDGYRFQLELPPNTHVAAITCTNFIQRCASVNITGQILSMTLNGDLVLGQSAGFNVKIISSSTFNNGDLLSTTASFIAPNNAVLSSATDTNTVVKQTITYEIAKATNNSSFQGRHTPGERVTYRLAVNLTSTNGFLPTDVPIARITDTLPTELSNVTWQCDNLFTPNTTTSGCLPQSGVGNIDTLVGGSSGIIFITVSGDLDAAIPLGTFISNTVHAEAIAGSPLIYSNTGIVSSTATFMTEAADIVRYTFTKSKRWDGDTIPKGANRYYLVDFYNYGPATYVGQINDVVQDDFRLTKVVCLPMQGLANCGAGAGVSVTDNAPSSQNVNINIVVPPGEVLRLELHGDAVGEIGTVINNTARLIPDASLRMQNLSNQIISQPTATIAPVTITGVLDITRVVKALPPAVLTGTNNMTTVSVGASPSYQVTFENVGEIDANQLQLRTHTNSAPWNLQPTWTCVAVSPPGKTAICPAASGTGNAQNWISSISSNSFPATIPVGGKLVFTIVPTNPLPSSIIAPSASFYNMVTFAGVTNFEPNVALTHSGLGASFLTQIVRYNSSITKSSGLSAIVAGDPVTYHMTIRNNNTIEQPNLRVIDPLNNKIINAQWTCAACNPSSGTGDIDTIAHIPANASISIQLTGNVNPSLPPNSTLLNTASLLDDTNTAFSQATDIIAVSAIADVGVTKTASISSYPQGVETPVIYTIQVTNHGSSTAVGTPIMDTAPIGVRFDSWSCDICALTTGVGDVNTTADLAQNQTATLVINATVTATASGTLTNTVTADNPPGYTQSVITYHPKTATASIVPQLPVLTLTKLAVPASFVVGAPANYSLTITNTGVGATTTPITITDTVPNGLNIGVLPSECSAVDQLITCVIPTGLISGTSHSLIIPVTATAAAIGAVTNTASMTGGGDIECPTALRCNATVSSNVNAPQLLLEKTVGNSTFLVGVPNSYTLKLTNQGTAATTALATITDNVPVELTLGTLPAGCVNSGQTVTCDVSAGLEAGGYVSFIIPVTPNVAGNIVNTATVTGGGDTGCPAAALRCTSHVTANINSPQLVISKTVLPETLVVNQSAVYRLTVTNIGTAATTASATIIDQVADAVSLTTPLPNGCNIDGNLLTCIVPAGLLAGSFVEFDITVTPTVSGVPLTNTASVIGGGDPSCLVEGDCTSTVIVNVSAPQLKLTKTASSGDFIVGQTASYTLSVLNQGDAPTTAIANIIDVIPSQLEINLTSLPNDCQVVAQQVTCQIAAGLMPNAVTNFVIEVTPLVAGTGIVNTATVLGGGDPGCPHDNTRCNDSVTTNFNAPVLEMSKTQNSAFFTVGLETFYTLTVTNTGSAATTADAVITDNIPAALTIGTLPSGCNVVSGQIIQCIVASGLSVNGSQQFIIPVIPNTVSVADIVNRAVVSGGGDLGCPAEPRCISEAVQSLILSTDLRLTKSSSAPHFVLGVPGAYTLTLTNQGTAATNSIATVTDVIPGALRIDAVPNECSINGQVVTCTVATGFAANESRDFIIQVTPVAIETGLINTATINGGDPSCIDPLPAICFSNTVMLDIYSPVLLIEKVSNTALMPVGVRADYTINVTNTGQAATTSTAVITDTLDSVFTIDAAALPSGCTLTGQTVSCEIPAGFLPQQSIGFTLYVIPNAVTSNVSNIAQLVGGGDPSCTAIVPCVSNPVIVDIVDRSEILIEKSVDQQQLTLGVPATYTITLHNTGMNAVTSGLTIIDDVPAGLNILSTSSGCTVFDQQVTCNLESLGANSTVSYQIVVVPTAQLNYGDVTNIAMVDSAMDSIRCSGSCQSSASANFGNTSVPEQVENIPVITLATLFSMLVSILVIGWYYRYRIIN